MALVKSAVDGLNLWADLMLETTSKRRELFLLLGKNSIKEFEDQIDYALFGSRQSLKLLLKADGTAMYPTRRLTSWNSLNMDSLDQASAEQIASMKHENGIHWDYQLAGDRSQYFTILGGQPRPPS